MKKYIALIEEGVENYGVIFPDVPGVMAMGDTYDEAVDNAREALAFHLEDEEQLPQSRTLEQIRLTWEDWAEWKKDNDFLVTYIDIDFIPAQASNQHKAAV